METRTWSTPECPFNIDYSLRVLDDIRLAVMDAFFSLPRGGAEIGGILLGRREDGRVIVTDSVPLDCEHAFGPSFTLSPRDLAKLEQALPGLRKAAGPRPVGWYHSHTRSEVFFSDADQGIHKKYFPEPWQVALVLKPHTFQPTRAGFFFYENGGMIHGAASYREFALDPLPVHQVPQRPPYAVEHPMTDRAAAGPVITIDPVVEVLEEPPELPKQPPLRAEPPVPDRVPPGEHSSGESMRPELPGTAPEPALPHSFGVVEAEPSQPKLGAALPPAHGPVRAEPPHPDAAGPPRPDPVGAEPSKPEPEADMAHRPELVKTEPGETETVRLEAVKRDPVASDPVRLEAVPKLPPVNVVPIRVEPPEQRQGVEEQPGFEIPPPRFLADQPAVTRRRWPIAVLGLAAGVGLGVGAYQTSGRWLPLVRQVGLPAIAGAKATAPIGLSVSDQNGQLQLQWNRENPAVRMAVKGLVTVVDGTIKRNVELGRMALDAGQFAYGRQSERVDVELRLIQPGGGETLATGMFVGSLPQTAAGRVGEAPKQQGDEEVARLRKDLAAQQEQGRKLQRTVDDLRLQLERRKRLGNQAK